MVSCKPGDKHSYVKKGFDGEWYIFVCSKCGDILKTESFDISDD